MIDTYLKSKNKAALEDLKPFLRNIMNVTQGFPGIPQTVDESGSTIPAEPAIGDPEYFYTCVRSIFPVPAFGEVQVCDPAEGISVCGVWA